jgi:uncharacterized protein (TIGR02147 family)
MIFEHNNYRSFLKAVLADKIAANPQFSLRSFGLALGISHAALSQVFNGKKNISYERALDIAQKLKLEETEQEYLCLLVQIETVRDMEKKIALHEKLNKLRPASRPTDLNMDIFRVISEWYHFPILSMTRLKNFKFTPKNIAKRLGISELEAAVAIERLVRVEFLEQKADGTWAECKSYLMIDSETPSSALRKFHRQMLEKSMKSIDDQKAVDKVNGSETFAFNPKSIKAARDITEKYFNEMVDLSEKTQKKDGATDVFHLQVNFFNLTPDRDNS